MFPTKRKDDMYTKMKRGIFPLVAVRDVFHKKKR